MEKSEKGTRKEDRRITRTRTALHEALRELVLEKGYEAVTIEDITGRANVGRTTFYLHYRDKEDLLFENFKKKLFEQVENAGPRPMLRWLSRSEDNIVYAIFELVQENADLFKSMMKAQSNSVYTRFQDIHVKAVTRLLENAPVIQKRAERVNFPLDFIIDYYSGALWSVIIWWVEHDFTPGVSQVTEQFLKLFNPGLLNAFEVKNPEALLKASQPGLSSEER